MSTEGQAAVDHIVPMGVQLIAAARTLGFLIMLEHGLAQQQVTFMTGDKLVQRQLGQGFRFDRIGHIALLNRCVGLF
ncbi:hypothetical protein PPS11_18440 [Pseudomonas putida S11]|nr:hypothetical protein PPS11_18440 [Pseudomonas putida S11]